MGAFCSRLHCSCCPCALMQAVVEVGPCTKRSPLAPLLQARNTSAPLGESPDPFTPLVAPKQVG